jgi:hypothetical protein
MILYPIFREVTVSDITGIKRKQTKETAVGGKGGT